MAKILVTAYPEYIMGHLRYGYREGILEIPDNELDELKVNPKEYWDKYFEDISEMDLIVTDYRVEDVGPIDEIKYEILEER